MNPKMKKKTLKTKLTKAKQQIQIRSRKKTLDRSLALLWALWPAQTLAWPNSCVYLPPKSTVAPKIQILNWGNTCCLFRYSAYAGFTKPIVGI